MVLSLDMKTNTVNTTKGMAYPQWYEFATWSAYLKGVVMLKQHYNPSTFTPSEASNPRDGWDDLNLTRIGLTATYWNCGAAAYNGTKLFYIGRDWNKLHAVFVMDVKNTWTRGPPAPSIFGSACAVTGDQLIVWGGDVDVRKPSNKTYVYNMKTEKWVSRYIAPPLQTTTTHTSQPSQTQAQHIPYTTSTPESENASSGDMKLVTIIVIVTGILLATILGFIFGYHGQTRQFNSGGQRTSPDGSSTDSLDTSDGPKTSVKELSVGTSRRRDPSDSGSDSMDRHGRRKWCMNGLLGQIYQGSLGVLPLSEPEHPHAIVEGSTTIRNVQEGALETHVLSQQPHAIVGERSVPKHSNKPIWESTCFRARDIRRSRLARNSALGAERRGSLQGVFSLMRTFRLTTLHCW
ncbi:MAG: hypothetical protein J3Q66DRAFT_334792 [Benniella sp.]|nr:MAG: hypothetical protein J3Q66DRAFT_334792 [Benniella sp.]